MLLKVVFEMLVPSTQWQNPRNSEPESFLHCCSFDARETPQILMELHQAQAESSPQNFILLKKHCQKFLKENIRKYLQKTHFITKKLEGRYNTSNLTALSQTCCPKYSTLLDLKYANSLISFTFFLSQNNNNKCISDTFIVIPVILLFSSYYKNHFHI